MELITLAIGLVLGGACIHVLHRLKAMEQVSDAATLEASAAAASAATVTKFADELSKHNHEISLLYDKLNMRRQ